MIDPYRAEWLAKTLNEMKRDEYFIPAVRCADGRYINLDEGAIKLLIDYYTGDGKKKLKRIVYVPDSLNNNKYVLIKEYGGFGVYQQKCPSGYFVSQEWLVYNGMVGFISQCYNNMCVEELYEAIDNYNETGKFGFRGFKTKVNGIYGVHPNNNTYAF